MREFYGFVGSPHFNEENSLCHTYKDQADLVSDLEYIFSETKLDKLSLYLNNLDHETNSIFKVIKLIEVSCFKTNSINLKNDILWNSANTKNKVIKNLDFKLRKFFNQKIQLKMT